MLTTSPPRLRTIIVTVPIMVGVGWTLYNRLVLGKERRYVQRPPPPEEESSNNKVV
jgi:hypothetical protein